MSSVVIQEVLTVLHTETSFPAGTLALASATATITGTATGNTTPVTVTVQPTDASETVPLIPDTYNYSIQNVDTSGNNLGSPFTGSFVVAAPPVTLNLVTGLTAS